MIQFLEHKNIDKKKWDACIQHASNGIVYANSWYLDLVSPGWNALIAGDYTTVFPLTWRKKYGFCYLHQPFFTQQLGVFSEQKNISAKTLDEFLKAIPDDYRLVEIQLNTGNTQSSTLKGFSNRLTHHLELSETSEILQQAYSDNLKRNIKKATKNSLQVLDSIQTTDIIRLFKKNKGKDVHTLKNKDYELLENLVHEGKKRKLITQLGIKSSAGHWCAGAVFLHSLHEYIFLFSAVNDEARETGAMSLLINHFIRLHAGEKKVLDFEGSMDKNLARFYKSFGSKEMVYLQFRKNNLPSYVRWIKN